MSSLVHFAASQALLPPSSSSYLTPPRQECLLPWQLATWRARLWVQTTVDLAPSPLLASDTPTLFQSTNSNH
ncbi:unnamed protein product, partial [Protopolystoma xenopodis]